MQSTHRPHQKQLIEYDRMKMAATSRDDDAVLDWLIGNAKRYDLSLDLICPILRNWFGPSQEQREAA